MDINLSAFREPRGVMRVFHFIFSICAFATISGYTGYMSITCGEAAKDKKIFFEYPFQRTPTNEQLGGVNNCNTTFGLEFGSDAKFFVATGVLAMLYSLAISVVYIKFDDLYKSNTRLPLIDFCITVIFGVLWLSSSAAWANSLTGIKYATDPTILPAACSSICKTSQSSFSSLNISVIFGFLNFFLWAADLWFLYKETTWFQGVQPQSSGGV